MNNEPTVAEKRTENPIPATPKEHDMAPETTTPDGVTTRQWENHPRLYVLFAEGLVEWIIANKGQATYEGTDRLAPKGGRMGVSGPVDPRIAISTPRGTVYAYPGDWVSMTDEWFDPLDRSPAPLLNWKTVRSFSVSSDAPGGDVGPSR